MTVASTGTGTITLGSAATINGVLYLSFAAAGVADGETVAYSINDVGGSEAGTGVYTAAGTTLARTPVTSTNSNNAINMTAAAIVRISPLKADIANLRENNTFTGIQTLSNNTPALTGAGALVLSAGGLSVALGAYIGDGATASAGAINLNSGNGGNQGSNMGFRRAGTLYFNFGLSAGILGGASNDFLVYSSTTGAGATAAISVSDANGGTTFGTYYGASVTAIKTANYTVLFTDNDIIFNGTGSITVTLPAAATFPGRYLRLKTIAAFTVVSASSNVVPLAGGGAGTAILAATAGKYALLKSNGTAWDIWDAN